ncbi:MAG: hypothetical protein ACRDXB_22940 [Actinomycetes bacterium]
MTAKERLREIVEGLDDAQAERALNALAALGAVPVQRAARPLPRSVGHGSSGRSDLSARVDDILAEGFGR